MTPLFYRFNFFLALARVSGKMDARARGSVLLFRERS